MSKTRREFAPEFKREAVALLESSGRPLTQVAGELGIQPSMLRSWRRVMRGAEARPQPRVRSEGVTTLGPSTRGISRRKTRNSSANWTGRAWSATC